MTTPLMRNQSHTPARTITNATDLTTIINVGDFLARNLYTDTTIDEVVKVTPKTVTLRTTTQHRDGYIDESCERGAYGTAVKWHPVSPNPDGRVFVHRLTNRGTIKAGKNPSEGVYYFAPIVNGQPVERRDWRF